MSATNFTFLIKRKERWIQGDWSLFNRNSALSVVVLGFCACRLGSYDPGLLEHSY